MKDKRVLYGFRILVPVYDARRCRELSKQALKPGFYQRMLLI